MTDVILGVVTGLITGAAYALLGYAAAKRKNDKMDFDAGQFGTTVAIGAIAGGVFGFQGINFGPDVIDNFVTLSGSVGFIYTLKKLGKIALG